MVLVRASAPGRAPGHRLLRVACASLCRRVWLFAATPARWRGAVPAVPRAPLTPAVRKERGLFSLAGRFSLLSGGK